jgi:hypothetical protein
MSSAGAVNVQEKKAPLDEGGKVDSKIHQVVPFSPEHQHNPNPSSRTPNCVVVTPHLSHS